MLKTALATELVLWKWIFGTKLSNSTCERKSDMLIKFECPSMSIVNIDVGGFTLTWWLGLRGKWPRLMLRRWWWWWRCDDDVWWQWWWIWSRKPWLLIRPFPYIWVCRSQSIKQGRLLLRGGLPLFRITPVEMMIVMRIIIFALFQSVIVTKIVQYKSQKASGERWKSVFFSFV